MKSNPEGKLFSRIRTLNLQGRLLDLTVPKIMGILNVTPDSFYDGGKYDQETDLLNHIAKMLEDGATFIDIGAYSSRPGATDIPLQEELKRALRAIRLTKKNFPEALISIDTFRNEVAYAAVQEGASLVNDISAGNLDPKMIETVAGLNVPYIAMHMRGDPATMRNLTSYQNLMKEITTYFHEKISAFHQYGINDIIVDPGFGFAKTRTQNFTLLDNLQDLSVLGKPILVGLSRKSMIWKTLATNAAMALNGTTALHAIALLKGADILRVHDVKEAAEVVALIQALNTTD